MIIIRNNNKIEIKKNRQEQCVYLRADICIYDREGARNERRFRVPRRQRTTRATGYRRQINPPPAP